LMKKFVNKEKIQNDRSFIREYHIQSADVSGSNLNKKNISIQKYMHIWDRNMKSNENDANE
jgi:hypothetical protein